MGQCNGGDSAAAKATVLFPMSAAFRKHSSLTNRLPGTPVKVPQRC
jgi:hypothetical protein